MEQSKRGIINDADDDEETMALRQRIAAMIEDSNQDKAGYSSKADDGGSTSDYFANLISQINK